MSKSMQSKAADMVAEATRLLALANEAMRKSARFGDEPDTGTILVFNKTFGERRNNGAQNVGLLFDPATLVRTVEGRDTSARMRKMLEEVGISPDDVEITFAQVSDPYAESRVYTYVALHAANGGWYLTSPKKPEALTWEELVDFIGDSPCARVTSYEEIPLEPVAQTVNEEAPAAVAVAEAPSPEEIINANRKELMKELARMRANGKSPTPKQILDAIGSVVSGAKGA